MPPTESVRAHSRALSAIARQVASDDFMIRKSTPPKVAYAYHAKELREALKKSPMDGPAIQFHRRGMAIAISEDRSLRNLAQRQRLRKAVAGLVAQKAR